ncbi:MAG TPA: hypothetical protein VIU11_16725 [Nakamurella sp.]
MTTNRSDAVAMIFPVWAPPPLTQPPAWCGRPALPCALLFSLI